MNRHREWCCDVCIEGEPGEDEETSPIPEQDRDPYGYLRRKEVEVWEQSLLLPDPYSWKCRRDISEELEYEDELYGEYKRRRGRKRRRS